MKLVGVISAAALSLLLGVAAVPVYAQEQHEEQKEQQEQKDKPAKAEEKHAQTEEKKAQQEKPAKQEERTAQQDKNTKQEENAKQEEKSAQRQDKNAKPEEKNAQQQQQHTKQAERAGGDRGGRIPDDRYRANFGREHTFHVSQGDYRDHRFQYGGYWFGFVDPWPTNWLYTQDVFVVDIDGVYYLCNPAYPGINIALSLNL